MQFYVTVIIRKNEDNYSIIKEKNYDILFLGENYRYIL